MCAQNIEKRIHALRLRFDGDFTIDGQPLLLEADPPTVPTKETGHRVWDCGIVLAKYVDRTLTRAECSPLKVVEVGCGTGIGGLALALKGADVTLTDLPGVAERTQRSVQLNKPLVHGVGGAVQFRVLDWRQLHDWDGPTVFDLIVATDCVWHQSFIDPFTKALLFFVQQNPVHCKVLMAHKVREEVLGEPFFAHLRTNGFALERVPQEHLDPLFTNNKSDIWELRLTPVAHQR